MMLDLLRSLLPASAVHVLWVGDDSAGTVSPADRPYDALIFSAGLPGPSGANLPAQLAEARAALAEEGRLLVVIPDTEVETLGVALAEAGFVLLREERAEEGRTVLAARRDPFVVRAYREGDEKGILNLFQTSFHVERSLERWRWEYRENPYGELRITEAFAPDGSLVAHYAGYPVFFSGSITGQSSGNKRAGRLLALQVGDTMTAAAFRHVGRGPTSLLGRSVRHFYAHYCAGRVAFNYGFNTGNIQRFSMRFVRAERLEDCPYRVLEGPGLAALEALAPQGLLGRLGWRIERVHHFDARFDRLFARARDAYGILVERDARYLEWRYATCPGNEYFTYALFRFGRLAGWSVFRRKGDRLVWGDALFDPQYRQSRHAAGRLLAHVLAQPEHRETRLVEGWLAARPAWWDETVTALGFERRPEPQELGLVYVPFEHDPGEDFRRHLYYTWGDSDLF